MEQIAKRVTDFYCRKQSIDPDVRVIYQVGFDVLFSTILQVTVILLAGLVLHHVQEAVLFLAGFYLLRQYGGGYHAKSRGRCLGRDADNFSQPLFALCTTPKSGKNFYTRAYQKKPEKSSHYNMDLAVWDRSSNSL